MCLEVARLNIIPSKMDLFEKAFQKAQPLISATKGFQKIEVRPCIEEANTYLLLVWWDSIDAHEIGFRQSSRYEEWKQILHGFYDPHPVVEHYAPSIL